MKYNTTALLLSLLITASCGESEEKKAPQQEPQAYQSIELEEPKETTNYDVEFVEAARNDDFRKARALLDQGKVTLLSTDTQGTTALMVASQSGNEDIIELLLDRVSKGDAIRLDLGDQNGNTALMYAVKGQQADVIETLLEHGANPNVFNKDREFPIHLVVRNNDFKSAQALVEQDSSTNMVNLNASNVDGKTPLHVATEQNNQAFLRFLKQAGANINAIDLQGLTPLDQAVLENKSEIMDVLLSLDADVNHLNSYGKTALTYAVENKNLALTNKLLAKKADPNKHQPGIATVLQTAVSQEGADIELIKALIAAGAKLESNQMPQKNVLTKAMISGNAEIVELLLNKGAKTSSLEEQDSNGLIIALELKDKELAKAMLKHGAQLNKTNANGYSPLSLALKNEYNELAIAMLQKNADLNLRTNNNNAVPFEIIFADENIEILEYLLKNNLYTNSEQLVLRAIAEKKAKVLQAILAHGASPDIADPSGQPAIWLATAQNELDIVKVLHQAGANIEEKDQNKQATPLLISIVTKSRPLMSYYLAEGANPNTQDAGGLGALAYAILTKQSNLLEPLLQAGARTDIKDSNGNDLKAVIEQSGASDAEQERLINLLAKYRTFH